MWLHTHGDAFNIKLDHINVQKDIGPYVTQEKRENRR